LSSTEPAPRPRRPGPLLPPAPATPDAPGIGWVSRVAVDPRPLEWRRPGLHLRLVKGTDHGGRAEQDPGPRLALHFQQGGRPKPSRCQSAPPSGRRAKAGDPSVSSCWPSISSPWRTNGPQPGASIARAEAPQLQGAQQALSDAATSCAGTKNHESLVHEFLAQSLAGGQHHRRQTAGPG
jgi:hypothetical protein